MSGTSGKMSGTDRGDGWPTPSMPLTELLARDGSPWRPFDEQGVLIKALKTPRDRKALFAACEARLTDHIVAVCLWPEKHRDQTWRIGDYAFYALHFEAAPGTSVYVQIWSEPDEEGAVHFEISSGHYDPGIDKYLDADRQERIRACDFEIGETAKNFLKCVAVHNARHARALGREFIAILCDALGYDGTLELTYRLHLGTISRPAFVFDSIGADDLAKLMDRWGFVADLKPREEEKPRVIGSRTDHGYFSVILTDPAEQTWRTFERVMLRAYRKIVDEGKREPLVNLINGEIPSVQASLDEDGDLALETAIFLQGGVTAEHLRARFEVWRGMLAAIAGGTE